MNTTMMFGRATDEWATPQSTYDALDNEFGFLLDAAATAENTKCSAYITKVGDALTADWMAWLMGDDGDPRAVGLLPTVWLNPPYSLCREFIGKAAAEARRGCTVVCLVPSRTDTQWWHKYVWDRVKHRPWPGVKIRFIKGRLKFGGATSGAPFPSVVLVFRPVPA